MLLQQLRIGDFLTKFKRLKIDIYKATENISYCELIKKLLTQKI